MNPCPCCGEAVYSDDIELCSCCVAAECNDEGDDCQIPQCPCCGVRATFCTDGKWHSNCSGTLTHADWIVRVTHKLAGS